ncbi:MAG TPA: hypothetical protein VIK92_06505 [Thermaerobacter sp.]
MIRFLLQPIPYALLGLLGLVALAGFIAGVAAIVTGRSNLFRLRSRAAGWATAAVSLLVLSTAIWVGWEPFPVGRSTAFTKPRWNATSPLDAVLQRAVTPSNRGVVQKVSVQLNGGVEGAARGGQPAQRRLVVTLRANRARNPEGLQRSILEDSRRIMRVIFERPAHGEWQVVVVHATHPTTRRAEQPVAIVTMTRAQYESATAGGELTVEALARQGDVVWLPPLGPGDTGETGELRLGP